MNFWFISLICGDDFKGGSDPNAENVTLFLRLPIIIKINYFNETLFCQGVTHEIQQRTSGQGRGQYYLISRIKISFYKEREQALTPGLKKSNWSLTGPSFAYLHYTL